MNDLIHRLIDQLGYLGVALLMFAETIFPPIPSEVIMPLAGMQVARSGSSLIMTILAGTAGAMTGNVLWYILARVLGIERFRGFIARHGRWLTISWRDVERGRSIFARGGALFVCVGRLIPTIRSIASIPAGLLAMPFPRFLVWSTVGTAAWTGLLASAGALLGRTSSAIDHWVGIVSIVVIVGLVAGYVWRVATWRG